MTRWECSDDDLLVEVTVPWNATVTVSLPTGSIEESGISIRDAATTGGTLHDGIDSVTATGDAVVVEAAAGTYRFFVEE